MTDGVGLMAECVVTGARPGELDLTVLGRRNEPEPAPKLVVAQAILKGDRGELAVELMTEVGVDVIVPWAAQRCVARWRPGREDKALDRWRSSAREAAKQSRRCWFPWVAGQAGLDGPEGLAGLVTRAGLALLLDPAAKLQLTELELPRAGEIVLIVGPEGGVSPAETADLVAAGAVPARLGPSVLRGSTAGAVASTLVLSRSGRWS